MKCPVCDGNGTSFGISNHFQRVVVMACHVCDGSGTVDNDYPRRAMAGNKMEQYRRKRDITMRAASKITGISLVTLFEMESGIIEPDLNLYPRFLSELGEIPGEVVG